MMCISTLHSLLKLYAQGNKPELSVHLNHDVNISGIGHSAGDEG
jgi:hypothetical protein